MGFLVSEVAVPSAATAAVSEVAMEEASCRSDVAQAFSEMVVRPRSEILVRLTNRLRASIELCRVWEMGREPVRNLVACATELRGLPL